MSAAGTTAGGSYLLALLLCGHILADFLFQPHRLAEAKQRRPAALLLHGLVTIIVQAVTVLPFWSRPVLIGIFLLGIAHLLIDGLKPPLERRWSRPLLAFFVDQGFHLTAVVALWLWLRPHLPGATGLHLLPASALAPLTAALVVIAGLVFNGSGGTTIVRKLLERYPEALPVQSDRDRYAMGRTIGVLERLVVFVLVILGQWAALGFVLAAKSIARFKELEERVFADYYLIGTLASVLVALASGIAVRAALAALS
jgi:hypothetical protein